MRRERNTCSMWGCFLRWSWIHAEGAPLFNREDPADRQLFDIKPLTACLFLSFFDTRLFPSMHFTPSTVNPTKNRIGEKKWNLHYSCHHHTVQSVPPLPLPLSSGITSTDQGISPAWGLLQHGSFRHQSIDKGRHEFCISQELVSFARGCSVGTPWFGSACGETPTLVLKGFL